jgi:alpha-tubulin suppressor-like RCC1 family protein
MEFPVDACYRKGICKLTLAPPIVPVWREVAVSMGGHGCALKLTGDLFCWGQGEHGQLGYVAPKECDGSGTAGTTWGCSGMPEAVVCANGPCNFTHVTTGARHTCAIDTNQDAWCWGDNYNGELGLDSFDPTHIGSPTPRRVFGGFKFIGLQAAYNATCGLTTAHQVYCWGNNQVSLIPTLAWDWANDPRLVPIAEPIADLDISYDHACGRVTNGNLYCWGSNWGFELGTLSWTTAPQCSTCPAMPLLMQANIPALANEQVSLVSTGAHGTCAHTASGKTPCWGWSLPVYPANRSLDRLSRGFQHYCAISRGTMQCAGMHALGDGSEYFDAPGVGPVTIDPKKYSFRELDTGLQATCAIGYDENVYCWGSSLYSQVGVGKPNGYVTTPTALLFPTRLRIPPTYTRLP